MTTSLYVCPVYLSWNKPTCYFTPCIVLYRATMAMATATHLIALHLPLPLPLTPPSMNTCNDSVAVAVTQCERNFMNVFNINLKFFVPVCTLFSICKSGIYNDFPFSILTFATDGNQLGDDCGYNFLFGIVGLNQIQVGNG